MFYTSSPRANNAISRYDLFNFQVTDTDPDTVEITIDNDGAYCMYVRMNDLAVNESDSFSWYYAASPLDSLEEVTSEVSLEANPPTLLSLISSDSDNLLHGSDSVIVSATFNKAMAATPTIEIDGGVLAATPMTATASSAVWIYTVDVNSLSPTEGNYQLTVNGTDTSSNAYVGTDSITLNIDTTPPTVTLAHSDNDGLLNGTETGTLTVTPGVNGPEATWQIVNLEQYPNSIVKIYNRNGQEVYSKTNYQNDWAGVFENTGQLLAPGSYYYRIQLNQEGQVLEGWLYLSY